MSESPEVMRARMAAAIVSATSSVLEERRRQIMVEGWTPEHDDQHERGELALAAATYAYAAGLSDRRRANISGNFSLANNSVARELWPFETIWWKPTDRRRDLVKAAALLLAEIERLDRLAAVNPSAADGASHG